MFMKKLLFLIVTCNWFITQNLCAAGGYADTVTLTNQQIQETANQRAISGGQSNGSSSNNNSNSNCQSCAPTDPATASMPYFIINWYGSITTANGTAPLLSSFTFPTNQVQGSGGFWINNAILTVHLLPPSNIVSATGITPISGSTNSYAIMYTLRSMDGNIIQKAMQYPNSSQTTPIMAISSKGTPQIPTSLSISTIPVPTTPPANPAPTPTVILNPTSFLPTSFSTSKSITQQRILNAISPFSQKFLINSSGGTTPTFTVTPLSGTFDTNDGSTLVTSFAGQSGNIGATNGANIAQLQVTLSDNSQNPIQNISFGQKNNFTTKDLQNGLALNVHIFPPSTSSSQSQYLAWATLRTLDGLKLHKIQFTPFTSQPAELSIQCGSAQFATIFLNSTAAQSSQAIGLISPINLRCLLQQTPGGTFNISML
jgi:hypothetical protein